MVKKRVQNDGVDNFNNELRPHFVKGVEAVLIFMFYQLQKVCIEAHKTSKGG
jgi:hypothetical protein